MFKYIETRRWFLNQQHYASGQYMDAMRHASMDNMRNTVFARVNECFCKLTGILLSLVFFVDFNINQAKCQTTSTPNVIVDESVLDELGPRFNLPSMMRRGERIYVPPQRYQQPYNSGLSGQPSRLLPAPNRPPRSRVTVPRSAPPTKLVRPAGRPLAPPKQKLGKGPGLLGQIRQSEVDSLGRKKDMSKPAVGVPTSMPTKAPEPADSVSASRVIPALPKAVKSANPDARIVSSEPPESQGSVKITPSPPTAGAGQSRIAIPSPPDVKVPKTVKPKLLSSSSDAKATAPIVPPPPAITAPPANGIPETMEVPKVSALSPGQSAAEGSVDGGKVTVFFSPKSTDIPPGTEPFFKKMVNQVKGDKSLRLLLRGYAGSAEGSVSQARRMSLFRALSVRTYLMKRGIRSTRMDIRALGNKVEEGNPDRVDVEIKK